MKNCRGCAFCKKDLICQYIKEADFYRCEMDGDMILDPRKEGEDCAWFKANNTPKSLLSKIKGCFYRHNTSNN